MILCSNPQAQYKSYKTEIDEAIHRVLDRGRYILGEEVTSFEKEFADFIGVAHGIGAGSGTEALHLALACCGIGPGDEVITVSHTAVATVAAIELAGAVPVLVDIEPEYYTLDPERLEKAVTRKTKAIVPVHLYGQAADMAPILETAKKHGLRVIEDCAQAHGATYRGSRAGSLGDMGCFSFYPTKNLGAIGDGGMVVTRNRELAERARGLREYGWTESRDSLMNGWNSRLDELQAAILRVKLRRLDRDNARRAGIAGSYDRDLKGCDLEVPVCRENATHVYHLYVIRSPRRDDLVPFLRKKGIGVGIHYPLPVHLQQAYRGRLPGGDRLSETERASREILSLPIYPELREEEVKVIVNAIRAYGSADDR